MDDELGVSVAEEALGVIGSSQVVVRASRDKRIGSLGAETVDEMGT